MSANAIETLRRHRPWRADMPKALGEYDAALAAVETLLEAAKELLLDDDMPNHWDDCVCSYCVRYRALAAAVRWVETCQ